MFDIKKQSVVRIIGCLAYFSLLIGCQHPSNDNLQDKSSSLDMTVGLHQRVGATDRDIATLAAKLDAEGVNIISVGQDYRVIIPVEKIFYYQTPRLSWDGLALLDLTARYLKQYRKVALKVSAFTKSKNKQFAKALSYARARAVSDYLWSQSVDARLIYTQAHQIESLPDSKYAAVSGLSDVRGHVEVLFRNTIV